MTTTARARRKPVRVRRGRRVDVRREEFERITSLVADTATALAALRHDLEIQFTRMAQIQNQLETVQRSVERINDPTKR